MTPTACHRHPDRLARALTLRGLPVCLSCACAIPTTPLHPTQPRRGRAEKDKEERDERD
jgi:hypothetical protein